MFPLVSFRFLSIPFVSPTSKQKFTQQVMLCKKNFFQIGNLQQTKMEGHRPFHPPIMSLMDKCPKIQRIHYIYLMSCPCNVLSFPLSSAKISFHFVSYHPKFTQNSFNEFCFHFLSFPFISPKIHPKFIQPVVLSFTFISFHFLSYHPKFTQNSSKIHSTSCAFIYVRFLSFPFISPKIHPKFIQPVLLSFTFISFHFLSYHPKFTQNSFNYNSFCFHLRSFPFICFHFTQNSPKIHPKLTRNSTAFHSTSLAFISWHFL